MNYYPRMTSSDYKIFVGGLTVSTLESDLEEYFAAFGQVNQIAIIRNKQTGLSKCYAFIHTSEKRTYERILSQKHYIQGRMIDCKDGFSRGENPQLFEKMNNKKFFVGGLSAATTDKNLLDYFIKFGQVFKAYVIVDPNTNRSKRFGFVIMESQKGVDDVMAAGKHVINGFSVNCKRFDRAVGDKGPHDVPEDDTEEISDVKMAEIMEKESSSTVFNRLSQLWSFAGQPSSMIFKYVFPSRREPRLKDFYDVDCYRGVKSASSALDSKPESQPHFRLCMNPAVYERIEDWHTRHCTSAANDLQPVIHIPDLETLKMDTQESKPVN